MAIDIKKKHSYEFSSQRFTAKLDDRGFLTVTRDKGNEGVIELHSKEIDEVSELVEILQKVEEVLDAN